MRRERHTPQPPQHLDLHLPSEQPLQPSTSQLAHVDRFLLKVGMQVGKELPKEGEEEGHSDRERVGRSVVLCVGRDVLATRRTSKRGDEPYRDMRRSKQKYIPASVLRVQTNWQAKERQRVALARNKQGRALTGATS